MGQKLPNLFRTHRRRWGFTQTELAFLLGSDTGTKVSRFEREEREPNLRDALSYQMILGIEIKVLLPNVHDDLEAHVIRRALVLHERLDVEPKSYKTKRKLKGLKAIVDCRARDHNLHRYNDA